MANFKNILFRIGEKIKDDIYNTRLVQGELLAFIRRRKKAFNSLKQKIRLSWYNFARKNEKRNVTRGMTRFFHEKFKEFFKFFLRNLFQFSSKRLIFLRANSVVADEIIFEFQYIFTEAEYQQVREYRDAFYSPDYSTDHIIIFLFTMLASTLGEIVNSVIKDEKIFISQSAGVVKKTGEKRTLQFLVSVRDSNRDLLYNYTLSTLSHYSQPIKSISRAEKEALAKYVDNIYDVAERSYQNAARTLAGVLYHFYRKIILLRQVAPILDFMNFICARIEDSVFNTEDLLKHRFLPKFDFSPEKKRTIVDVFHFLNNIASLSATFQANNRAPLRKQVELFLIYTQYFFQGGVEKLGQENSPLFFPQVFNKLVKKKIKQKELTPSAFPVFEKFVISGYSIAYNPFFELFFRILFNKSVNEMNERFFASYNRSLSERFNALIAEKNLALRAQGVDESISFNEVMDITCRFLYFLVKTTFLTDNSAEAASKNFCDNITRYVPRRIKLRVLEMELFREIPLSDNNWGDYLRTIFKDEVKRLFQDFYDFPENDFFSYRRIVKLNMIYTQGTVMDAPLLGQWLANDVLVPFAKVSDQMDFLVDYDPAKKEKFTQYLISHPLTPARDDFVHDQFVVICDTLVEIARKLDPARLLKQLPQS